MGAAACHVCGEQFGLYENGERASLSIFFVDRKMVRIIDTKLLGGPNLGTRKWYQFGDRFCGAYAPVSEGDNGPNSCSVCC